MTMNNCMAIVKVLWVAIVGGLLVLPLGDLVFPYLDIPNLPFSFIEAVVSATVGFGIADLLSKKIGHPWIGVRGSRQPPQRRWDVRTAQKTHQRPPLSHTRAFHARSCNHHTPDHSSVGIVALNLRTSALMPMAARHAPGPEGHPQALCAPGNEAPIHSAVKCQRLCDQLDQRAGARGKNRSARPL